MSVPNRAVIAEHIAASPMGRLLGVTLERAEPDLAVLQLAFRPELTTLGDLIHGGAIAALIDIAATAAAWTGADLARGPRGTTVSLTVNYLAGARGAALQAEARAIQRGRSLVVCDVVVSADARPAARALVTYKLEHADAAR